MCVENEWILRLEKKKDSIFGNGKLVDPSKKKKSQSHVERGKQNSGSRQTAGNRVPTNNIYRT